MKRALYLIIFLFSATFLSAQTRENKDATSLNYKSKNISNVKYWHQENGKWKSRLSNTSTFENGVQSDNFYNIFIGRIDSLNFLFIDYAKAEWKYPNIKEGWTYYRRLHSALITEKDYSSLKNIRPNEIVNIISLFNFSMRKNRSDYSFPLFLDLITTMYSSNQVLFNSYKQHEGEDYAKMKYKKENPPEYIFYAKRTYNNNEDVVRFSVFPAYLTFGEPAIIDNYYFEIPYTKYLVLFESDKKTIYK